MDSRPDGRRLESIAAPASYASSIIQQINDVADTTAVSQPHNTLIHLAYGLGARRKNRLTYCSPNRLRMAEGGWSRVPRIGCQCSRWSTVPEPDDICFVHTEFSYRVVRRTPNHSSIARYPLLLCLTRFLMRRTDSNVPLADSLSSCWFRPGGSGPSVLEFVAKPASICFLHTYQNRHILNGHSTTISTLHRKLLNTDTHVPLSNSFEMLVPATWPNGCYLRRPCCAGSIALYR